MAFSDAFLRGFTAGKYEDEKNTKMLTALLNRSSSRPGAAIAPARVQENNDPLARVNAASDRYNAEQLRDKAEMYAEQEAMDQSAMRNVDLEMKKRQLSAMPTAADSAIAKSQAAADQANQGAMARDLVAPQLAQVRQTEQQVAQNDARQRFYQSYVQGDTQGMEDSFAGMFPTSEITEETLKDKGDKDYKRFANSKAEFRKDDYGTTYVKYPGEKEWVPFNDQHVRQFMIASNPKLMRGSGSDVLGGGAAESAVTLSADMKDSDKIKWLSDQKKNNIDAFEARLKYAEAMATEVDDIGNKIVNPEKYKKALAETKGLMTSEPGMQAMNLPKVGGYNTEVADYIGEEAANEFANKLANWQTAPTEVIDEQGTTMSEHLINQRKMAEAEILKRYGPNGLLAFQDKLAEVGPQWFTGVPQMQASKAPFSGEPKSDVMITPGLPQNTPEIPGTEAATIDGVPVAFVAKNGQMMIKPSSAEPWRPMTKAEAKKLNVRLDSAYAERRELFDKIGKLAAAINTYGTGRKKGAPTEFDKFVAGVKQAVNLPDEAMAEPMPAEEPAAAKKTPQGETPESLWQKYLIARTNDQLDMLQGSSGDIKGEKIGKDETKESLWKKYQAMISGK